MLWWTNSAAEKKIRPTTKFNFLKAFGWMKILCFLCLGALEKFNIFLMCTELERVREENLIFQKLCPISAPSVQNWPNCGCRFWPFLSYAAKKSAKWQHCFHCFLGGGGGGGAPSPPPPPPPPPSWGYRNSCAQGVRRPGPGNDVALRKGTWRAGPTDRSSYWLRAGEGDRPVHGML
jgi:hypothetical protein